MSDGKWPEVSKAAPCEACGRDHWCTRSPDGGTVRCRRVQSNKPCPKGKGWYHKAGGPIRFTARFAPAPPTPKRNDLALLARRFRTNLAPQRLALLSRHLDLSAESLNRLDVGWSAGERMLTAKGAWVPIFAYSFPMRDPATDGVVGLRMRSQTDKKFAFTGGAGGLFIPRGLCGGRVYLAEGPTDTAAAIDIGLNAFGRESCSAGDDLIVALLKKWRFDELVIFSQRDEAKLRNKSRPELGVFYPAQDGAERTAARARLYCQTVRIIMPPQGVKDVRIWKQQGATAADVEREVLLTPSRKLTIAKATSREGMEHATNR
jgi:hypothetical protein